MLKDVVISNRTYAELTVADENNIDEIAMKTIKQDLPDFLLPIKIVNINGETEIRYEISDGIRLNYLSEKMNKREFLFLAENMLKPFKDCNDWFLDYHKFYLNPEYIIVSKDFSSVRYIYRFEDDYLRTEDDILSFFGEFVLKFNLIDDQNYILNLFRRTRDKNITLQIIMDYILQESAQMNSIINSAQNRKTDNIKKIAVGLEELKDSISKKWESDKEEVKIENKTGENANKKEIQTIPEVFGKEDIEGNLINNLFGEEPEKTEKKIITHKEKNVHKENLKESKNKGFLGGLFSGKKENKKTDLERAETCEKIANNQFLQETNRRRLHNNSAESNLTLEDVTVVGTLDFFDSDKEHLILKLLDDKGYKCPQFMDIDLTKGYASIGRYDKAGNSKSDYNFEASLSFISRRHCRIEKRNDQVVIIDLGSGNGTLVNEVTLVANMPYQINKGDRVVFSKNKGITYVVC